MANDFFRLGTLSRYFGLLICFCLALSTVQAQNSAAGDSSRQIENTAAPAAEAGKTSRSSRLDIDYYAGTAAQNRGYRALTILIFEKILEEDRNFRDVRKRLAQTEKALGRQSRENILSGYYTEARLALERNDFGWAQRALEKVSRLDSNYRDVPALRAKIERLAQPKNTAAAWDVTLAPGSALLDSLYREGIAANEQTDWLQALISFEKLHLLQPGYRDVADQLNRVRENIGHAKLPTLRTAPGKTSNKSFGTGTMLAAGFVLFVIGFIVISPTSRMAFHMWRKNYLAAAGVFEKLLERHPQKIQHYAPLAELYLRLGRNDERALKVYKTVLQLNLATRKRDEINALVAQNYLNEGRMDTDAIEVLEVALKSEMRKQNRLLPKGR
jgi:tetratricopeptide (TPR) repeat protein